LNFCSSPCDLQVGIGHRIETFSESLLNRNRPNALAMNCRNSESVVSTRV